MKDIIVIGGGAAGMTAALYSLRAGKSVLIIEKENFGGQIANSPRVENFPSIKEISGEEFSSNLFDQITNLGADFELENVEKIEKEDQLFKVTTNYNTYYSKAIIIATGVKHLTIKAKNEEKLNGKGVSYCAVCDGAFFKNEEVCVIGDANSAMQYALLLANTSSKVYLTTLFDRFFGDKILEERILSNPKIEWIKNVSLEEFVEENGVLSSLNFRTKDNNLLNLKVKGAFVAIGQVPDNKRFSQLVDLDEKGYIIAGEDTLTKTPGVFVAGDCRRKNIRQLTTAAADGAVAGLAAANYVK